MKNFRVTVNGNVYDVAVEELSEGSNISNSVPVPNPSPAPAAKPTQTPVASSEGNIKVLAPMPGNILDVKVNIGDKVAKNSVVVILEAMKMENEIVTPSAGTVASINVTKGTSVNSGDILITIAE